MFLQPIPVKTPLRTRLQDEARAIFLPAISATWARMVHVKQSLPGLSIVPADLNFLDPANKLFHYPYALFSAGQHNTATSIKHDIVSQRDRAETIVLGDSGGFQVQTIKGYFTPAKVKDNLRWMEGVSDYSMVMDFPTGGIARGSMKPHVARLIAEGWDLDALNTPNRLGIEYNACLLQTKLNNDAFLVDRVPGATAFLNVLQGRSEAESRHWYEAVKHYPFEGWAFAGHHQNRFSLILARLIDMREEGLLERVEWLHFLGKADLDLGVLLTTTLRAVRRYNPRFQISFDVASPFLLAANQAITTGLTLNKARWASQSVPQSSLPRSDEGRNLGDLLSDYMARNIDEANRIVCRTSLSNMLTLGDLRKSDGLMSTSGYMLATHHNVEALVDAHERAHQTMFGEGIMYDPVSIPLSIKTVAVMIEQIMAMPATEARSKIREWREYLDVLR